MAIDDRYSRQVLFERFGAQAQRRLLNSRAVLIGCGALGSVVADTLVRAGVGFLRVCDRDFIERDNLQRQVLFDEDDLAAGLPKAEAAGRKLRRINSDVTVEAQVIDVNAANIEWLAEDAEVLLDGTDNFETRFLINDLAVKTGRPWVYGAVVGATGLCMPIIPNQTPCLRCVFESAPPASMSPTCDTAGVLGPAVKMVASFCAMEAMKLLAGLADQVTRRLINVDAWSGRVTQINTHRALQDGNCICCKQKRFEYLDGSMATLSTTLCGRNAVQLNPARPPAGDSRHRCHPQTIDFVALAEKLAPAVDGKVHHNEFMLRAELDGMMVTLFRDGRAIIKGTESADRARSIYAKYIGS